MSICNKHLYCEKCECFINNMCFEPYTLNDLTTKYGKEPKKRYCGYNPIDTSERREKIRTMMGLDKDFNLHDVLVTQKNCLCIDDSYKNIDCYTLQHIVDMICFDEYDLNDFHLVEIPNSDTFHFQNSKNNKHFFVIRIYGQPDIHGEPDDHWKFAYITADQKIVHTQTIKEAVENC